MEKKNKIIAGLALGAAALLVASGIARCSLAPEEPAPGASAPEQPPAVEQPLQQDPASGAGGDLSEIENTTWKSVGGKSTLTVMPGVLIEKTESAETLFYYEASDVVETETGITATLSVSKEKGGQTAQTALAVTKGNGQYRLACDALSADYSMKTADASIAIAGSDDNLTGTFGKSQEDFAAAISKWAPAKSPYATKATWSKEAWIDYGSGSKVTTFTIDDGAASVVSVTLNAAGELVAS